MSLRLEKVSFAYDNTTVLQEVTWQLPTKGVVCLWGPSGCGKTTILRLLAGLEKPQAGYIAHGTEPAIAHDDVSMVFQEDRLLPWFTALQNVMVTGADEATARNYLSRVGLTDEEMQSVPDKLSGGQQRRVALVRALATDSDLLLLDEPFNGLDENTWQMVVPLINEYAEQKPVILVTHIREQAEALSATMIPLKDVPVCGALAAEKL